MKKLVIKVENGLFSKTNYHVSLNKKYIEDLVIENLPQLDEYKDYIINAKIEITFLDEETNIQTEGYEVKQEEEESEVVVDGEGK